MRKRKTINTTAEVHTIKKQEGLVVDESTKQVIIKGSRSYTDDNPAYVNVSGKVTRNTGNFNSVSITVGITLPCDPNAKNLENAYVYASDLVEEYINEQLENAEVNVEYKTKEN